MDAQQKQIDDEGGFHRGRDAWFVNMWRIVKYVYPPSFNGRDLYMFKIYGDRRFQNGKFIKS